MPRVEGHICAVGTKAMVIRVGDGIRDELPLLSCQDNSSERPS